MAAGGESKPAPKGEEMIINETAGHQFGSTTFTRLFFRAGRRFLCHVKHSMKVTTEREV